MWRYDSQCLIDIYFDLGHIFGNINMIFNLYNRYAIFNPDGFFPLNEAKTKFSPLGVIICENLDLPDTENF